MGIDLTLVLGHSLEPADLVTFPQRALASAGMQHAARRLWQVMSPRWANLGPVEEFARFRSRPVAAAPDLEVPTERVSEEDVVAAWEQGYSASFEWAGFDLHFGKRAVAATHLEKLAGFVLDLSHLRAPLQACARALAWELRSPSIVYGPDSSSPFEEVSRVGAGDSLPEILATARRKCGAPAGSIRQMADESGALNLDERCYYIEVVDLGEG